MTDEMGDRNGAKQRDETRQKSTFVDGWHCGVLWRAQEGWRQEEKKAEERRKSEGRGEERRTRQLREERVGGGERSVVERLLEDVAGENAGGALRAEMCAVRSARSRVRRGRLRVRWRARCRRFRLRHFRVALRELEP